MTLLSSRASTDPQTSTGASRSTGSSRHTARRLAVFLAGAGTTHFLAPKFYDAMVPTQLPGQARQWTYGSGVAEFVVAAAVANPRTRRRGALLAAALFVGVFPANIKMFTDAQRNNRPAAEQALMTARLPLQLPLVIWALRVARAARR